MLDLARATLLKMGSHHHPQLPSLTAHSDGPGCGATFTLELPYLPAEEAA
ncbi:hypothetical protein [Archangium sp.]|nr:hypothetical protein [Archangium sp.]HYO55629.1 hypothetical protein [Archangium sp.]